MPGLWYPVEGEGVRLMWHPAKAAFRAGFAAQDRWDELSTQKYERIRRINTTHAPWVIIRSNDKHRARMNAMKVILNAVPYTRLDESLDFAVDESVIVSGSRELERMEVERVRGGKFTG